ncbi:hypothetical protein ACTXM3_17605 [Glutamicibacter arilaitensis]|uniref:hypothetical protein n=1 Tax=Glutamicibacter arilaitensis TaxID=256701 RepID=UPI003FD21274
MKLTGIARGATKHEVTQNAHKAAGQFFGESEYIISIEDARAEPAENYIGEVTGIEFEAVFIAKEIA